MANSGSQMSVESPSGSIQNNITNQSNRILKFDNNKVSENVPNLAQKLNEVAFPRQIKNSPFVSSSNLKN